MKRILCFILFLVFMAVPVYASTIGVAPKNLTESGYTPLGTLNEGLIGYWSFDGSDINGVSVSDRSGNENNGTLNSGPVPVIGVTGQGIEFDGNNDGFSVDDPGGGSVFDFATGDEITFSVWIYPHDLSGIHGISGKGQIWGIETTGSKIQFYIDDGGFGRYRTTGDVISVNEWTHVAFTHTMGTSAAAVWYINGKEVNGSWATGTGNEDPTVNNDQYLIADMGWGGEEWDGFMDEFRLYNRALTAREINRLYNISHGGGTLDPTKTDATLGASTERHLNDGLVGYWSLDGPDISGTTALDRSGQGNDGTLNGNPAPTIGRIGQGLDLDGSGDYMNSNYAPNFTSNDSFSFLLWLKIHQTARPSDEAVVASDDDSIWMIWEIDGDSTACGDELLGFSVSDNGSTADLVCSTTVFDTVKWYHLAATYDVSGDMVLYIDGEAEDSTPVTSNSNGAKDFSAIPFYVGANNYFGAQDEIDGEIDEVRLYNRALTAQEVKRIYNMGK